MSETQQTDFLTMTSRIVSSYVANNTLGHEQLPDLIRTVYETCATLSEPSPPQAETPEPAIAVSKSITPDFLICLEDGRKLKMLKRYLRSRFDMTPDEYREKWNLPADYPMVSPNYAKLRSKHAKQIGLGKKPPAKKSK
ncbi:MucR family transcriptional regulator [Hyphomonas pacifica]|uniref:MucR family transcriptional regulator n=1 Tax=Hyphomonas pacifica TaxID=1280941 RepID=A0A062TXG8_9PROT|nr:MucR family transcriptional regulator [Hyphomonas pacifica]KCZ50702.1 hypothetical protein HY2_02285 [Hyphomonas pacifica]RAN30982.1 hypothetical protein HY3_05120 [Hyphomonas pacifica]RAN34920.1 hypothetical protein HY11_02685 [Hyphomonas pacifica]